MRRLIISTVAGVLLLGAMPNAGAHTDGDIRVRKQVTSVSRSMGDITVRGKLKVRDLTGTYTIVDCRVQVRVGGNLIGTDHVNDGFAGRTVLRFRVRGSDPGGTVGVSIKHCHSFADA